MSILFDSKSDVNIIYLMFVQKLGLFFKAINIGAQKIDGTMLNTYEIIVITF